MRESWDNFFCLYNFISLFSKMIYVNICKNIVLDIKWCINWEMSWQVSRWVMYISNWCWNTFVLYDRHVLLTIYYLSYYLLFLPPKVLVLLFNEKQSWIIYFSNSGLTIYGLGTWKMPFGRFPVVPAFYNCIYRLDRICRNELAVKPIFLWQRQPHVVTEYILFICIKILTEQRIFLLSTLQIIPFCRKFIA